MVSEWISENAIQIRTVEAGNGFEDLLPLGEMVDDARIVSLGEPTHGNREVFQLKHRFIEYLVTERGFNLFALECPFGEAFDVNQYILEGTGTPEEALAGINWWTWDTKEIVELLKWMRTYNADTSHLNKIKFYGFDMQDPERASRIMLEYLQKADPQLAREILPELNILQIPFSDPKIMGRRPYIPEEYDAGGLKAIKRVMKSLHDNKKDYLATTSREQWTLAEHHARQVEMYIDAAIDNFGKWDIIRDKSQAENIKWMLDHEGVSSKAIVWAHNTHVSNASRDGVVHMGNHLKKMYGDELKIFGFFFNQGGFWAVDVDVPSRGMDNFYLGPAPEETLEYILATAGLSLAAIPMDSLPAEGPVRDWFHTNLPTRHSGAGYNVKTPEEYFWSYTPAEAYDVLVFLDSTTPVAPVNRQDFEVIWMLDKKLDEPLNLDFESNRKGDLPEGWLAWTKFERVGAQFNISDENPFQGKNSVALHRPRTVTFGELTPNLTQTIDATPYQGKKIRITAVTRSDVEEPALAFFRLVIEPDVLQSAHDGSPPLFDSLDQFRINSSQWEIQEIEAEVPEIANTINYGVYLRDSGTVWLDEVRIEVIDRRP